jgi:hypothetical protein
MTASLCSFPRGCRLLAAVALLSLVAGCEGDQAYRKAAESRQHAKPPPPLAGKETFFDGRITAELQTGAGFGDAGKLDESTPGTGGGGRHGGGGGGMHMGGGGGGGGGRHGGGGGGGRSPDSDPSVSDSIEQDQIMNMRRAAASGGPPVIIHLRFTNNGTAHADLAITDFLSELGNFVVQPEKLALDPGQSAEVEPMTSRLAGEIAQADITLTLSLDGHAEKKVITLFLVPTPPPSATPPDAAPPAPPPPKN